MGYKSQKKSPKGAIHVYTKSFREKGKNRKRFPRPIEKSTLDENHIVTEREITELTLRRLHTLGSQKFGSSMFGEHFDRWLADVTYTLGEFESHPNMNIDDQFVKERSQKLYVIKQQLEERRLNEASLNQEIANQSYYKRSLEQINTDYVITIRAIKAQKNSEIKQLYRIIDSLKIEQEKIIQMKTGFFRGISRKDREQKEIEIAQEINDKQRELELIILGFSGKQKNAREDYEKRREPVLEQIKKCKKIFQNLETDDSLEERWFACEALIDEVNSFLQRKATQPIKS